MSDKLTVNDNMVVSMDYTLHLDSGEMVDSSEGREPLAFLQGHGQIIPGLERELVGMAVGDAKKVTVTPADGYGERDAEALQVFPHDAFPDDMALSVGMPLHMRDTETGHVLQAFVAELGDAGVVVDFNHPLAGATLHFDVKIISLREATSAELEHGHAHGPDGHAH